MLVGFAKRTINPDAGVLLGGYPTNEPRRTAGIHDDLIAMAVSCRETRGDPHIVLLAFDGIAVPEVLVETLRAGFGPGVSVLPIASHTHAAPAVEIWDQAIIGDFTPSYVDSLLEVSAECVAAAIESEGEGNILAGASDLEQRVGANRRDNRGDWDPRVRILEFRDAKQAPLGLLVIYGCHPTVLSAHNQMASADLAWGMRQAIDEIPIAFLPGGAGNQSTRATRTSSTFEECLRLGALVGSAIGRARENAEPCTTSRLAQVTLEVEPRSFVDVPEAERRVARWQSKRDELVDEGGSQDEVRRTEVQLIGARHDLRRAESGFDLPLLDIELFRWDLGSTALAFWPVEPGFELARQLEDTLGTWLCGYAGGYYGYLLDPHDFDAGGYEVAASPFRRNEAERFLDATHSLSVLTL